METLTESCGTCRHCYGIRKYDYSKGGCEHSEPEGYICMAFGCERVAVWIVGLDPAVDVCEEHERYKG